MIGSEIRPIEITDAATTPVVAASSAPTKTTASARPPRTGPNSCPIVYTTSSAIPGPPAGGAGQQCADEDHRQRQAATDGAEQLANGFEQVFGHAAALQDQPHQREE